MSKISFKEQLVLVEARNPNLQYKEKVVKNSIDKVIVELEGHESGVMTKIAGRYQRLDDAIKKMTAKRDEFNEQLKERVVDLFNAEDIVLTRVVETSSFTVTLSKVTKSAPKFIVNYEKIAEELAKLIPEELQVKIEEITKQYTQLSIAAAKSPSLTVKKVDENLNEGIVDFIKSITVKISKWINSLASWAVSYDKKLANLKTQLKTI